MAPTCFATARKQLEARASGWWKNEIESAECKVYITIMCFYNLLLMGEVAINPLKIKEDLDLLLFSVCVGEQGSLVPFTVMVGGGGD